MSKSGSSAGSKSGAGRRGRSGPAAAGNHATTRKGHAAERKASGSLNKQGEAAGGALKPASAKSGNQARKVAQQARAIAKKKAKRRG